MYLEEKDHRLQKENLKKIETIQCGRMSKDHYFCSLRNFFFGEIDFYRNKMEVRTIS